MIQATEIIKLILEGGAPLIGRLLLYDAMKMNFKEGSAANRIALGMMKRIMTRIRNIAQIKAIRAWRETCQKEALLNSIDAGRADELMDELRAVKIQLLLSNYKIKNQRLFKLILKQKNTYLCL